MNTPHTIHIYRILKTTVREFFEENKTTRYANRKYWSKIAVMAILMIGGYTALLVWGSLSIGLAFLFYFLFILGTTLLVVNLAHDASHKAVSPNATTNKLLSYSWNLLGISKTIWEIKHHHAHHIYTNIPHQDTDIAESPLLRLHANYPQRRHYRFQHLYAPILYGLFGIYIVYVKDFVLYVQLRKQAGIRAKTSSISLPRLIYIKLQFLVISYLIPLFVLLYKWWIVLLLCFTCMAICGALMLLVLIVPHINETASVAGTPTPLKNQDDWALWQIYSTVDASTNSAVLNYLSGGLNTHLVHHLFPNICHIHYRELTKRIKEILHLEGIPYHETDFGAALKGHFSLLKSLGNPTQFLLSSAYLPGIFF